MEIIVLYGDHSSGKTTALNIVHSLVTNAGGLSTNKQPLGGDPNDFSDVVLYNGQKVAFFTMGDFSVHLINAIHNYNTLGMDKLVCACNTRFVKPPRLIATFTNFPFTKTTTSIVSQQLVVNTADANRIFSRI